MNRIEKKRPILLFHLGLSTFVRADLEFFQQNGGVKAFQFSTQSSAFAVLASALRQFFWTVRHISDSNGVVVWFADHHAVIPVLLARLFGKKSVIILGGFECNFLPEFKYGIRADRWRFLLAGFALRHASLLAPVSEALVSWTSGFGTEEKRAQGIRAYFPKVTTTVLVVPTGYDDRIFSFSDAPRGSTVLSVAMAQSERTVRIKGLDIVVETARNMPDISFTVIGTDATLLAQVCGTPLPPNLAVLPPMDIQKIIPYYQQSSVLLHLSRTEGLANVLVEAMLCGCVPVVSNAGGNKEAVSTFGVCFEQADVEVIALGIRTALAKPQSERLTMRNESIRRFHKSNRENFWRTCFDLR